jgi:hypothetical protein
VVWLVGQHGSLVLEPWTFDPWSIHPCNIWSFSSKWSYFIIYISTRPELITKSEKLCHGT